MPDALPHASPAQPFAPQVVLLTMFEPAEGPPGEFAAFREAEQLRPWLPLPGGHTGLWANPRGLLATITGIGTAHAASSVMALGLDPRLDLRHTTFLLAGIAGINPARGSLGSVAWARYVVDADLAHEIDPREMPADWPDGRFPLGSAHPATVPAPAHGDLFTRDETYELDSARVDWAYDLTRDLDLSTFDTPGLAAFRSRYQAFPAACRPPAVMRGDLLAGSRFWHGQLGNRWADAWVAQWTAGKGSFVTSAMEENGALRAFRRLHDAGRVDFQRILVLRAGSNFTMPPADGTSALASLTGHATGSSAMYPGYDPARLALQRVASVVIHALLDGPSGHG